jgi:hypothetical protein
MYHMHDILEEKKYFVKNDFDPFSLTCTALL